MIGEHFPAGSATPVQIVVPEADARGRPRRRDRGPRRRQRLRRARAAAARAAGRAAQGRRRHRAGPGHDEGRVRQPGGRGHRAAAAVRPRRGERRTPSSAATPRPTSTCSRRAVATCGSSCRRSCSSSSSCSRCCSARSSPRCCSSRRTSCRSRRRSASRPWSSSTCSASQSSDPSIVLYGFVFLVALGIDYSIFLMTRVREEAKVRGTRPGILVGLAVTGGVITSAGIVLAATFSALAVLPLVFLVQIAFIVAFGVLLDTFVVRSLLVPAAAYDIGAAVWWPRHLRRRPLGNGGASRAEGRRPRSPWSPAAHDARRAGRVRVRRADIHAPLLHEAGCDVVAVSTRNPERAAAARDDLPGVRGRARPRRAARGAGARPRRPRDAERGARRPGAAGRRRRPGLRRRQAARRRRRSPRRPSCGTPRQPACRSPSSRTAATTPSRRRSPASSADGLVGTPFRYEMRWERWRPVPKDRWRENASAGRGRRHPARPAQPPRRRRGAAVRPRRNGVRHGGGTHDPGRGRRLPRLPARRWGGVAPRGDLAVGCAGAAGAAARHRGGVRDGRLHRRGPRVDRSGRRRRGAQRLALPR